MTEKWIEAQKLADLLEKCASEEEVAALAGASDAFLLARALCLLVWRKS